MSYKKYEIKLNQSLIIHFFMHSLLNYFFNERDNAFNMSSIIIITSSNYQIQQEILVPSIKEASQLSILVYKYLLSLIKSVCSIFPLKMPKSYLKKRRKSSTQRIQEQPVWSIWQIHIKKIRIGSSLNSTTNMQHRQKQVSTGHKMEP